MLHSAKKQNLVSIKFIAMLRYKIILPFIFLINIGLAQVKPQVNKAKLPIGVFDSGTGGLTVLQAMLTLDAFNNVTGLPGADGIPDFTGEQYQYLADQANMPYGNYAAENKTDLLKEHIIKNMQFFLQTNYSIQQQSIWVNQKKLPVKMIVIACNTATAYALADIKAYLQNNHFNVPCIGVIDAGTKAALAYQQQHPGTIGVFATAGTVASNGYPRTLKTMAKQLGMNEPIIVSQGGFGLAESIDRDWSYFVDTITAARTTYKGPSLKNEKYKIDTALMDVYHFNKTNYQLLCEYDDKGSCQDIQLNDPSNYVRYHLVSLLEKMRNEKIAQPLNTLILGCTHYPYMKDTIANVLTELYNYENNGTYRYRNYLAQQVELIDPSVETAKEAYLAMRFNQLKNYATNQVKNNFFIAVPNTALKEIELQPDGWFTYQYKYGRVVNANKVYVKYTPFNTQNVSLVTYNRFKIALPNVYESLLKSVPGLTK